MSKLLQLANETIFQIFESVTPDDITNSVLCCKDLHRLGQDALQLHRAWKKAFSDLSFQGCEQHELDAHPMDFLAEICNDWRISYYVRSMAIACSYDEERLWKEQTDRTITLKREERALVFDELYAQFGSDVQSLMAKFPHVLADYEGDDSGVYIWKGEREPAFSLLLLLLPNLRSVSISQ